MCQAPVWSAKALGPKQTHREARLLLQIPPLSKDCCVSARHSSPTVSNLASSCLSGGLRSGLALSLVEEKYFTSQ